MSNKCDNCNKNITKSKPGLECNRCEKLVHLTNQCTGLTNKQLAALRASENLEWTCQDCQDKTPRRSSIVIPNDDEGDEDYSESPTIQIDVKKLLGDISKEVERAIKKEMKDLTQSLQFQSDKMDELIKNIEIIPPGPVIIELNSDQTQLAWLAASKSISPRITAQEICPHNYSSSLNTVIFICEALTQYNKQLLYYAKQELKDAFRYIWIKKGVLRVRREGENQKPIIIRSSDDIKRIKLSAS
ncbi:hypothetical protein ABMA28_004045 [Loxostege sticticalis]|uniref:FP protein C-terminal domain-containing protein n=1 Tax=Loxostege sticticalis TaxID=481309 RepID=A0ABD0SU45_LOXSC